MRLLTLFALLLMMLPLLAVPTEPKLADIVDAKRIKEILGADWHPSTQLVIESEKHIDALEEADREMARSLFTQMKAVGVIACANLVFDNEKEMVDILSLKVFRFEKAENAEAFRKAQFENKNVRKLSGKTELNGAIIYDNTTMSEGEVIQRKRTVFLGAYMIACDHMDKSDLHLTILQECIRLDGWPWKKPEKKEPDAVPPANG